jgi:hypothetical protein
MTRVSDQMLSEARGMNNPGNGPSSDGIVLGDGTSGIANSFAGAAGVITVIQNTGSNVVLQNATVVNVTINK